MHGWGGNINSFEGVAYLLCRDFCTTLIDMYGFGETPHPDYPLVLQDYADSVVSLMQHYNMEDVILVGHSFGGRVAMRVASKCSRVTGLVLVDSAGMPPRRGAGYYARVWKYKLCKKLKIPLKNYGSADYRELCGVMKKTFINIVNENNLCDTPLIVQPTLIVWGDKDKATPMYMCKRLKRRIKYSEVVRIRGAGHFGYIEQPILFYRVLKEYCKGI